MTTEDREPVSRRGGPPRQALSRRAIVEAALAIADRDGLDDVTMRRVAHQLDTGASALYVYIRNRDDLLDQMFDHVMADANPAAFPEGTWRERLAWLLLRSIDAASGHGGLARVALTTIPAGPNATAITTQVRELLSEAGLTAPTIAATLDLLGRFVTAAALDRGITAPVGQSDPGEYQRQLRWEMDVILNGLTTTPAPHSGPDRL